MLRVVARSIPVSEYNPLIQATVVADGEEAQPPKSYESMLLHNDVEEEISCAQPESNNKKPMKWKTEVEVGCNCFFSTTEKRMNM